MSSGTPPSFKTLFITCLLLYTTHVNICHVFLLLLTVPIRGGRTNNILGGGGGGGEATSVR